MPFLVEDELKRLGGIYEKVGYWKSFAITDGHLITGQNPASSPAAAQNRSSYSTDPSIRQQLGGFAPRECRVRQPVSCGLSDDTPCNVTRRVGRDSRSTCY